MLRGCGGYRAARGYLRRLVEELLGVEDGRLKIKLKRVDLINGDAAFGNIQLFM